MEMSPASLSVTKEIQIGKYVISGVRFALGVGTWISTMCLKYLYLHVTC